MKKDYNFSVGFKEKRSNKLHFCLTAILLIFFSFSGFATDYTSVQDGNWNNSATWGGSGIPGMNDNAVINHKVTASVDASVNNLTIENGGSSTAELNLDPRYVFVYGNFTFNSGSITYIGTVQKIFMDGTKGNVQTVSVADGLVIDYFMIRNGCKLQLLTNLNIGKTLHLAGEYIDLNEKNISLASTANITMYTTTTFKGVGNINFEGSNFITGSALAIGDGTNTINLNIENSNSLSGATLKNNSNLVIKTGGSITAALVYETGSRLVYEKDVTIGTTSPVEWPNNTIAPSSVIVKNSSTLTLSTARTITDSLYVESGSTVTTSADLTMADGAALVNYGTFTCGNPVIFGATAHIKGDTPIKLPAGLTIDAAKTLNLSNTRGGGLEISGDFTNNGTFNSNKGFMRFKNTSAQTLSAAGETTFYDLELDNALGLEVAQNIKIEGDLKLTNGRLDLATNSKVLTFGTKASTSTTGSFDASKMIVAADNEILIKKEYDTYPGVAIDIPMGIDVNYYRGIENFNIVNATDAGSVSISTNSGTINTPTVDALNRYWTFSSTGITDPYFSGEITYHDDDIGTFTLGRDETDYNTMVYNGTGWTILAPEVDAVNNKLTIASNKEEILILTASTGSYSPTTSATQISGDWENAATWVNYQKPKSGENATINHNVYFPRWESPVNNYYSNPADLELTNLTVEDGAWLEIHPRSCIKLTGSLTATGDAKILLRSTIWTTYQWGTDLIAPPTGNIITNAGSVASVNIYMQSYLTAYISHFVATPLSGINYAQFRASYNTFHEHDETKINDEKWVPYTGNLSVGKGYTTFTYNREGLLVTMEGALNDDLSIDIPITKTIHGGSNDGWNLVGNPYPCSIDWDHIQTDNSSDVNTTMKIWNGNAGSFSDYVADGTSTNDFKGNIPAMQGFYVNSKLASTDLTIHKDHRFYNPENNQYKKRDKASYISGKLSLKIKGQERFYDEALLIFTENEEKRTDMNSLEKMFSPLAKSPQIYFVSENKNLSIHAQEKPVGGMSMPLGIKAMEGVYTITTKQLEYDFCNSIYLYDNGVMVMNLQDKDASYTFNHNGESDENRFSIVIGSTMGIDDIEEAKEVNIFASKEEVFVKLPANAKGATVQVYSVLGKNIASQKLTEDGLNKINLSVNTGTYIVKVVVNNKVYTQKVFIK